MMMSMREVALSLSVLAAIVLPGAAAKATILGIDECGDIHGVPLPFDHWSFDYDSQLLEVSISVRDIPGPSDPPTSVVVTGHQDAQSTLTIVENVTNETGAALTGYGIYLASPLSSYSEIVAGSIQATGAHQILPGVTINFFDLVWSEPIPSDGVFTIQFDVFNYQPTQGYWGFAMAQSPALEPGAATLLGLGGLVLARTRRFIRSHHKA